VSRYLVRKIANISLRRLNEIVREVFFLLIIAPFKREENYGRLGEIKHPKLGYF
jgi:hypothetical protein